MRLGDNMEKMRTENSYKQFNEYARRMLFLSIIYSFICIASLVVFLLGYKFGWIKYLAFDIITVWLFVFSALEGIPLICRYIKERKDYKNFLKIEVDNFFEDMYIYVVYYEGEEKKGTNRYFYNNFKYYRTTKNYVLLYYTKKDCKMIPKSDEFIEFINSKGVKKKW